MLALRLPAWFALTLVSCVSSALVGCSGTSDDPVGGSDAGTSGDASSVTSKGDAGTAIDAAVDAYVCVNVDLTTYDQTCEVTSDCLDINGGHVCSGACGCGGALINKSGAARYNAATKGLLTGDCPCAAELYACDQGKCAFCPFGPAADGGCADAGASN